MGFPSPFFIVEFKKVKVIKRRKGALGGSRILFEKYKDAARALIIQKLQKFQEHYGYTWGRVSIRNQRSRWGSCSKKGNLNFNYRLIFLPEALQEYIIVHEMCHLREFNHSRAFWALVGEVLPDYSLRKKRLMRYQSKSVYTK